MPRFSVVIAVYNKQEYLKATLDAVLQQSYQDFELVIVNDGSTDHSKSIIEAYTDARIRFYHQENKGAGAARNFVIEKATGEYIALLDADDRWLPNHLETIEKMIAHFPSENVFATNSNFLIGGKLYRKNYSVACASNAAEVFNFFDASRLDSIVNSSTAVVHRSVFDSVGVYDPTIKSGQDTDLFIRIGLENDIVFHPQVTVEIVRNTASLSHTASQISEKADFKKFEPLEAAHPKLKKYLDQNRYSLCILAKRSQNKRAFQENIQKIDLENLNANQRRILKLPGGLIRILIKVKKLVEQFGIRPVIRK